MKKLRKLLLAVFVTFVAFLLMETTEARAEEEKFLSDFTVSKQAIYKGNGVSIYLSSAKTNKDGLSIVFIIKNKSSRDYGISAHEYAVNNLMAGGTTYSLDVNVPAGKKAKLKIFIKKEWFRENSIKTFKKFDIMFWAYGDYMKEWESGTVSFSTDKDNGKKYYKAKGKKVYSDENFELRCVSRDEDTFKFCLKNKTESEQRWSLENCSVNDWSYDLGSSMFDLYNEPILSGCYATFELNVDKDFKEENSIGKIKTIEFNLEFDSRFDDDNNFIDEIETDKIVVKSKWF